MTSEQLVTAAPLLLPILLAAAAYFFLFWRPVKKTSDPRPAFKIGGVHWGVIAQVCLALVWIPVALRMEHAFYITGHPIYAGLALATAVPGAFSVFGFVLALVLVHALPKPERQDSATAPAPVMSDHMKRRGRVRLAILLGACVLEVIFLPAYGQAAAAAVIGGAMLVFLTLHKLYDY